VFATFGNIAAIGVACAFVCAISITPVLAVLRPTRARQQHPDLFERLNQVLNHFRHRLRPGHYVLFYLLSMGLSACALLNHYHNDPLDYFAPDTPIAAATRLSEQARGIHHPLVGQLDTRQEDGIFDPEFLTTVNGFET